MAYVLPEKVLAQQLCSSCKQYLSCPPTKIYVNGEIKCGRCSSSDDDGTVSTFEILARQLLFPCSNRFGGCPEIMHYADVKQHEKNCRDVTMYCPNCPNASGSILFIIHHFTLKHFKEIIDKPKMDFDLKGNFERFVLYCDYEKNKVFLLRIRWQGPIFSVSCFSAARASKIQLTLSFCDPSKEDLKTYRTDTKTCLCLEDFPSSYAGGRIEFQVPVHLTKITCNFIFNLSASLLKIPEFHVKHYEPIKKGFMRKIYLSDDFKEKHKNLSASGFTLSNCNQKLLQKNYSLHIVCDFCVNFFASSGNIKDIYTDLNWYVCGTCHQRGIDRSLDNISRPMKKLENPDYHLMNFYCKHGCGKFCRSGELLSHEDQCALNVGRTLSEEEYVKTLFGKAFVKADKYFKGNVVVDANKFKGNGKILIATRDNFKCIIDYEHDGNSNRCNFHVNHEYDPARFYVEVHKWEDGKYNEEFNDFSMKTKNCEGPSLFAVALKTIQEEDETFYDV